MRLRLAMRRPARAAPRGQGVLLGASSGLAPATGRLCAFLDVLDLDAAAWTFTRIPLPFVAHGIAVHPTRADHVAVLEKRGAGGAVVDLATRPLQRRFSPLPGHVFYGHAAWSADGRNLFVAEARADGTEGAISVRDGASLAEIGRHDTAGQAPHDCLLADGGRTLLVANRGGPLASSHGASIVRIELSSGKILERRDLDDPARAAGHLAMAADGTLALALVPRGHLAETTALGGLALAAPGDPLSFVADPHGVSARLIGEALSIVIHAPTRTVIATHPHAGLVSFWSLDGGFRGALAAPQPRGLAATGDGRDVVISYGAQGGLLRVDPATLRRRPVEGVMGGVFGGAHLAIQNRPSPTARGGAR